MRIGSSRSRGSSWWVRHPARGAPAAGRTPWSQCRRAPGQCHATVAPQQCGRERTTVGPAPRQPVRRHWNRSVARTHVAQASIRDPFPRDRMGRDCPEGRTGSPNADTRARISLPIGCPDTSDEFPYGAIASVQETDRISERAWRAVLGGRLSSPEGHSHGSHCGRGRKVPAQGGQV